jgi:hypothetical protein
MANLQRFAACVLISLQFFPGTIQLWQHRQREIDIDPLNRSHHRAGVGEKAGNIVVAFRDPSDLLYG